MTPSARIPDLTGKRFGHTVALAHAGFAKIGTTGKRVSLWRCKCDCGREHIARANNLQRKRTKSCGCRADTGRLKHGLCNHPLYTTWHGMRSRCYVLSANHYDRYGGRGIAVDAAWDDFGAFVRWSEANGWKPGLQLHRTDNDGNYSPENCQWLTDAEHRAKHTKAAKLAV